jgi:hypothetical protein
VTRFRFLEEPVDIDLLTADVGGVPRARYQQAVNQGTAEGIQMGAQGAVAGQSLDA